jgi:hypothetical protein
MWVKIGLLIGIISVNEELRNTVHQVKAWPNIGRT